MHENTLVDPGSRAGRSFQAVAALEATLAEARSITGGPKFSEWRLVWISFFSWRLSVEPDRQIEDGDCEFCTYWLDLDYFILFVLASF